MDDDLGANHGTIDTDGGTVLGDDSSLTDRLVVAGDTAGDSLLAMTNVGGIGAQAQLYSNIDCDDFTDVFGARVSLGKSDSLQGRLGLTLDHQNAWQKANGMLDRTHLRHRGQRFL